MSLTMRAPLVDLVTKMDAESPRFDSNPSSHSKWNEDICKVVLGSCDEGVWLLSLQLNQIYRLLKEAYYNEQHYSMCVNKLRGRILFIEISVMSGSGASGISGWYIWSELPALRLFWLLLLGFTTFVASLKPILKLDYKLEQCRSMWMRYRSLYYELDRIKNSIESSAIDIQAKMAIPKDIIIEFERARARFAEVAFEDPVIPSRNQDKLLADRVTLKFPQNRFWFPLSKPRS